MTQSTAQAIQENPFTPVFGKVPAYLAGRDQIINDMINALEGNGNDPNRCSLFVGARGTGKTALLSFLGLEAQRRGWIVADVTACPGMLDDIYQRIVDNGSHLLAAEPGRHLTGIEIAPLGSVSWSTAASTPGTWRTRMNGVFGQLGATDTGILITVDEIDPDLDEMVQLATTYQHFVREDKKVALIMAGLPHRVNGLLSGKSTSFLRRAAQHQLGSIPDYEVKGGLRLTVQEAGRTIDDDAVDLAADEIAGFPFMFQLVGYRSWNAAGTRTEITREDVAFGAQLAREELRERVFEATLSELSPNDVAFLKAMALDEGASLRADITERLGKSSSHVSTYKKRLLNSGVIEEPRNGVFTFALPGFGDFIRSLSDETA